MWNVCSILRYVNGMLFYYNMNILWISSRFINFNLSMMTSFILVRATATTWWFFASLGINLPLYLIMMIKFIPYFWVFNFIIELLWSVCMVWWSMWEDLILWVFYLFKLIWFMHNYLLYSFSNFLNSINYLFNNLMLFASLWFRFIFLVIVLIVILTFLFGLMRFLTSSWNTWRLLFLVSIRTIIIIKFLIVMRRLQIRFCMIWNVGWPDIITI